MVNDEQKENITLLVRNEAYTFNCNVCGQPAQYICSECSYEKENPFYCEACNSEKIKHQCGDEYSLSVCNSPRMGVCAYNDNTDVFEKVTLG